jgi:hypothetical protein
MPGMIYTPDPTDPGPVLTSDAPKWRWTMMQHERSKTMFKQMAADKAAGFDYVGYHNYAKRRYFELSKGDIKALCDEEGGRSGGVVGPPNNSTCAYAQMVEQPDRTVDSWFEGCACFMAKNFWG